MSEEHPKVNPFLFDWRLVYGRYLKLMADIAQLQTDIATLQQAVADDAAATKAVQSYVTAQGAEIVNLQAQLANIKNSGTIDDSIVASMEASINALKSNNTLLSAIPAPAATGTGTTTDPAAPAADTTKS